MNRSQRRKLEREKRRQSKQQSRQHVSNILRDSNNSGNSDTICHIAMTKYLVESVEVMGSRVQSIHLMVCHHPDFANQGFCQIKTEDNVITFWSEQPFSKSGSLLTNNREWSGIFRLQIINGVISQCYRKFSMKNIQQQNSSAFPEEAVDIFQIEDIICTRVGVDLPPEEIDLQTPLMNFPIGKSTQLQNKTYSHTLQNDDSNNVEVFTRPEPNYQKLVELYPSKGVDALNLAISDWLQQNTLDTKVDIYHHINNLNQIAMTVYEMASKQSQNLASHDPKLCTFTLKVPFEPIDYYSYPPVQNNLPLAQEGMSLINTGFFDKPITDLINSEGDAVSTLRRHAVVIYMGTNNKLEIFDAACAIITLQPLKVVRYVGEQRNSLTSVIEKTFKPLVEKIITFRKTQKGADKFPCLSLLCIVQNKVDGKICEFRRHFTAQSGGQLIIPGFSSGQDDVVHVPTPMDVAGQPRNIPVIRGFKELELEPENRTPTVLLFRQDLGLVTTSNEELKSSVGMEYSKLRDLLAARKWREADTETARVMLVVAKREKVGWLHMEHIDNFPCEDLQTIDQLWVKYSNGRFGFSVQKRIYQRVGGTIKYDKKIWNAFGDKVGWRKEGNWLYYREITFDIKAPEAHLPVAPLTVGVWGLGGMVCVDSSLAWRLVDFNI